MDREKKKKDMTKHWSHHVTLTFFFFSSIVVWAIADYDFKFMDHWEKLGPNLSQLHTEHWYQPDSEFIISMDWGRFSSPRVAPGISTKYSGIFLFFSFLFERIAHIDHRESRQPPPPLARRVTVLLYIFNIIFKIYGGIRSTSICHKPFSDCETYLFIFFPYIRSYF